MKDSFESLRPVFQTRCQGDYAPMDRDYKPQFQGPPWRPGSRMDEQNMLKWLAADLIGDMHQPTFTRVQKMFMIM